MKAFFEYLIDIKNNDLLINFAELGNLISSALKMAKSYIKVYKYNNNSLYKLI